MRTLLLLTLALTACRPTSRAPVPPLTPTDAERASAIDAVTKWSMSAKPLAASVEVEMMRLALALLYEKSDPKAAQEPLRALIRRNPEHYGAHFQLATALDRSGSGAAARGEWEIVQRMAERLGDQTIVEFARRRLAAKD